MRPQPTYLDEVVRTTVDRAHAEIARREYDDVTVDELSHRVLGDKVLARGLAAISGTKFQWELPIVRYIKTRIRSQMANQKNQWGDRTWQGVSGSGIGRRFTTTTRFTPSKFKRLSLGYAASGKTDVALSAFYGMVYQVCIDWGIGDDAEVGDRHDAVMAEAHSRLSTGTNG